MVCAAPTSPETGSVLEISSNQKQEASGRKHRRAKSAILSSLGWNRVSRTKTQPSNDGPVLKAKEVYSAVKNLEVEVDPPLPRRKRGIINMGNSCFLSGALQCLLATPGIISVLVPDLQSRVEKRENEKAKMIGLESEATEEEKHKMEARQSDEEQMEEEREKDASNEVKEYSNKEGSEDDGVNGSTATKRPEKGRLTEALCDVIVQLHEPGEHARGVNIQPFVSLLKQYPVVKDYFDGGQQDAQEVLMALMDLLHEDLNELKFGDRTDATHIVVPDLSTSVTNESLKADRSWSMDTSKCKSWISDTFRGQLQSSVRCKQCSNTFTMYEPFMELSLSLVPKVSKLYSWLGLGANMTLKDCLFEYTSDDVLEGDELFSCEKCNQKTEAVKQLRLHRLPENLILHIKRFKYKGCSVEKMENFVKFPVRGLDMRDHLSVQSPHSPEECIYDLYAVSNHSGSLTMGHYTANIRMLERDQSKNGGDKWYLFNDEAVSRMSAETVVTNNAYLLFYRRRRFKYKSLAAEAYKNLEALEKDKVKS